MWYTYEHALVSCFFLVLSHLSWCGVSFLPLLISRWCFICCVVFNSFSLCILLLFIKCMKLLPMHFLLGHLSFVIYSIFLLLLLVNYSGRSCGYCCCCFIAIWYEVFAHKIPVAVVYKIYTLDMIRMRNVHCSVQCIQLEANNLCTVCHWPYHWLKSSFNATNDHVYIYWITTISVYDFLPRYTNGHKTPEPYLNENKNEKKK